MEIYTNDFKFNLLPTNYENIIPNMFANATLRTFGLILITQGIYYIYWKRNFSYLVALKYLNIKKYMIIPFTFFWFTQLRIEFNKLKVEKAILKPIEQLLPVEPVIIVPKQEK